MIRYYKRVFSEAGKNIQEIEEHVQFLDVRPEKFYWANEQIIFNPFALNERAIMVDVMDVRDKTLKFNIEFGYGNRVMFREQFVNYWNSKMKANNQKINTKNY